VASVGWVGLGRLGAPCAAALAKYGGHEVVGYDVRGTDPNDYDFAGLPSVALCDTVAEVVDRTDRVVYVAVQTPHSPAYGGEVPTPDEPREFEYQYLVSAVRAVVNAVNHRRRDVTVVVVSTVLPGTFDRLLRPILNTSEYVEAVYHPFFIAMGTVVEDFIDPEMTLFGEDLPGTSDVVRELYAPIHDAPAPTLSIPSAELAKVAYNTFISMKIVYANLLAEMCDATGADVDQVTDALVRANQRLLSPRYLRAGMGDGGACHPRDNVALSALARRHGLSADLMGFLTEAREAQARRQAQLIQHWSELTRLPVVLLGRAYKPNVDLVDGSPALLLADALTALGVPFQHVDADVHRLESHVYFVATAHDEYRSLAFPAGSVVIDPFGYLGVDDPTVTYVTPGRRS
jgi:UDPglucose 6-dehydrogenase